ncbi:GIY-YIG nuclease family protein [Candidatus Accumulibacter vicinus]|uniref:T5orf172 domain protein n=1 Tax=Candidatus Accumulibacter vicinus TaxID=2954382 RepID=A0A084Y2A2_9PROT|nr:GIY-YIG nuclease family protein [Candidatus Accumulibacter vicinus]KFB68846.1 MAG: T5orf172 domain protein [Candidatus Accumulibacter vicinus]
MSEGYEALRVGHVYMLTNRAIPGFVKIGMTTRSPEERARALSSTGVPRKWEVHFAIFVPDCKSVERQVHADLKACRDSRDREFFKIASPEGQKVIQRRAEENIAKHPGWPDPISMKNHADRQALQERKAAEEERRRAELERAAAEKRRWEAEERERRRAEQEKAAEERRRQEAAEEERQKLRAEADADTLATLDKGLVGWGTLIFAGFWLIIGAAKKSADVQILAAIVTLIIGVQIRRNEKEEAIAIRARWNLPPVRPATKIEEPNSQRNTGRVLAALFILCVLVAVIVGSGGGSTGNVAVYQAASNAPHQPAVQANPAFQQPAPAPAAIASPVTVTRPAPSGKPVNNDMRHCLSLASNDAIARCAARR